ncbi:MAG: hypothetical protein A2138_16880 [Deltaproteobacteria bacterium RBG_16_71_12]|nr:MAG: hypothetical protein A2138_16880 [Deltaproteobacteria bacterium RBG_16_71_12]
MTGDPTTSREAAALLYEVPDAVLVIDRRERVLLANAAAGKMFCVDGDALVGTPLGELLPDAARDHHRARVAEYFAAPIARPMGSGRALLARRSDGTELPVEIALAPSTFQGEQVVIAVLRDRSAQVAAERARLLAEERAARAHAQLDRAEESTVLLDQAGRITHVNAAWARLARGNGADAALSAGVGLDYLEVCRRDPDAAPVVRGLQQVLDGTLTRFEHSYRANTPTALRRFRLRAEPLPCGDACGCGGAVVIHSDVTAAVLAEERLAVQRTVAEALAAGRSVPEVCRVLGDEVCRRLEWHLWEVWGDDGSGKPRLLEIAPQPGADVAAFVLATRAMSFEPDRDLPGMVWQSRRPVWIEDFANDTRLPRAAAARACGLGTALAVPLVSGGETFLMMSFLGKPGRAPCPPTIDLVMAIGMQLAEVSRRLRAEAAARAAAAEADATRAKLQAILAYAPGVVVELDRDGVIRYLNRPHQRPIEQLLGRSWLTLVPEHERPRLSALLREALETGTPVTYEVELPNFDGSSSTFSSHLGPLRGPAAPEVGSTGPVTGAVIVAQDVTEQRRLQLELDAAQRLATVGMLAAGVAHEINNPLAAVIANLALVEGDVAELAAKGVDAVELHAQLADAGEGVERIRGIARDLKLLARPKDEAVGAVDAAAVFETSLRLAKNELRHRARVLRQYGDVPPVHAAEGRLGQVLLNLLVNAAQALPDGEANRHQITVATRLAPGGLVCLEVKDTGPGIPDDVKPKLFQPFFTTKAPGVGTGLGLAICDKIVRGFGGRIEVESTLGQGATFRVLLPAAQAPPRRATPPAAAPASTPRRRVLVIDDEPQIGRAIARTLARAHDVTVATRAHEALELFERGERFHCIFCDVMMPEMSGPALVQALRDRWPAAAARVVYLTAGVFSEQARRAIAQSGLPVVDKPFQARELLELVAAAPDA